jgi:hypothetical protein
VALRVKAASLEVEMRKKMAIVSALRAQVSAKIAERVQDFERRHDI